MALDPTTVFLLQSDTTHGSTTFVDVSPSAHTFTPVGSPIHTPAQQKFGASSVHCNGSAALYTPSSAAFAFGTGDFTLDFWFRPAVFGTNQYLIDIGSNGIVFSLASGKVRLYTVATGAGSGLYTGGPTISLDTWYHFAAVRSGGMLTAYVNGTSYATQACGTSFAAAVFNIARYGGTGYYPNGFFDEIRVDKGLARWTANFTPPTAPVDVGIYPRSFLVQQYGAGPVQGDMEQSCGLVLGGSVEQQYGAGPVQAHVNIMYALKLGGSLRQPYGNALVPKSWLAQYYGDTRQPKNHLSQRYNNALAVTGVLEQPYNLPQAIISILEQRYGITGTAVQAMLDQVYDLHGYNLVKRSLVQPWMIAAATSLQLAITATVTIGGRTWDGYHINVESNGTMYEMTCDLQTADQAEFAQVERFEPIVITIASTVYNLVVVNKRRTRQHGTATYTVEGSSSAVLMDAPWSAVMRQELGPGMASAIAASLAAPYGVTVDWQIVDWYIGDNALYANDETSLAIIRKLAHAAGGVLKCEPDGTLAVVKRYSVSPPPTYSASENWDTVSPAASLTDQDNFFAAEEQPDDRPGYNRFRLSNMLSSTNTHRLDPEDVSATRKRLRAYIVPWADRVGVSLRTSRNGVVIQPLAVTDADRLAVEMVEFVNGSGQARYPVHEIVDMSWQDAQLGSVTYGEDGSMKAEVAGQSLLQLTYRTNFLMWQADDQLIEDVQFYLEKAV